MGDMFNPTELALVKILKRTTLAWVERLRRQRVEVRAIPIAAHVVDVLCTHVTDARQCRAALVAEMVRFVDRLPKYDGDDPSPVICKDDR
jgi:hypothetical protein